MQDLFGAQLVPLLLAVFAQSLGIGAGLADRNEQAD